MEFIRTCQECGHKQTDNAPEILGVTTVTYDNRKCRKCHSESLDYGSLQLSAEELAALESLEDC